MQKRRKWPWIAKQQWNDLLFMHWPVPYDVLRPLIPEALELETNDGQAWLSMITFRASHNRLRKLPGSLAAYLELNVRTYVRFYDEPGVYFLSLDASHPLVVAGAKELFSLPYFYADMKMICSNGQDVSFTSRRIANPAKSLTVSYRPFPRVHREEETTLVYWLTERYCLYTFRGGRILKGPISHLPWELQDAAVHMESNGFFPEIPMKEIPLIHFSKQKEVYFHPFEVAGKNG